jgi:hypothetical protein
MAHWMKKETRESLPGLVAKGFNWRRICAALGITHKQLDYQLRKANLKLNPESWNLAKKYKEMQGGRK